MPGHASASVLAQPKPGQVAVMTPGASAVTITDVRVASFTPEEAAAAEEKLARRAGPVAARVRSRLEATYQGVRAELNQLAGGQASARVMVLAHHAQRAAQALELQSLLAEAAFGEEADSAERQLRNQAGLAVVATECLNKAYEAARTEAGGRSNPTDQLMGMLGHGAPKVTPVQGGSILTHGSVPPQVESFQSGRKVGALSPLTPPGGGAIGAPHAPLPTPSGDSE